MKLAQQTSGVLSSSGVGLLRYWIEEASPYKTIIHLQPGLGTALERLIFAFMVVYGILLNVIVAVLFVWRPSAVYGRIFTLFMTVILAVIGSAFWFGAYIWLSKKAFACASLASHFYRLLSNNCGVQHKAISLPAMWWVDLVIHAIALSTGLAALFQLTLTPIIPIHIRVVLVTIGLVLGLIGLFVMLDRSTVPSKLIGQVAFIGTIAISLWGLVPPGIGYGLFKIAQLVDLDAQNIQVQAYAVILIICIFSFIQIMPFVLLHNAIFGAYAFARGVDYYRGHAEVEEWATEMGKQRGAVMALIQYFASGMLTSVSFVYSVVCLQDLLLGSQRWFTAPFFEDASMPINFAAGKILSLPGINYHAFWVGKTVLLMFFIPAISWGVTTIVQWLMEVCRYLTLWLGSAGQLLDKSHALLAAINSMSGFAHLTRLRLRIKKSEVINAYAIISPLPFCLPRIIVLSQGAYNHFPSNCLKALLAHEVGHIKLGHARSYTILRFLSRILLLGPGALTGLIKSPIEMETEADSFAVQWLEFHGTFRQDLVDVIRATEEQKLIGSLHIASNHGIGMAGSNTTDWLTPRLRAALNEESKQSFLQKMWRGWALLQFIVINGDLSAYTYLPFAERIRRINSLPHLGKVPT